MDILTLKFENITEDTIDKLITYKIKESINLDYKSRISDYNKLVKHICAFANTRGGLLVIGVETNNLDEPVGKTPVKKEKEKLEMIINSGITPRVSGVLIKEIDSSFDSEKCFCIIKIPMSVYGHMVTRDRDHKFYRRSYTRKNFQELVMEEHEVEELYNRRFIARKNAIDAINRNLEDLKDFQVKGKAVNVIVKPLIPDESFFDINSLDRLLRHIYNFSIDKTEITANGCFYASSYGAAGLTADGCIMGRIHYALDDPRREEKIYIGRILDVVIKILYSAIKLYNLPSVIYTGGFILKVEIEDTIGRYEGEFRYHLYYSEPKLCKVENISIHIIVNELTGISIRDTVNDLLKKFIGHLGISADESEFFADKYTKRFST